MPVPRQGTGEGSGLAAGPRRPSGSFDSGVGSVALRRRRAEGLLRIWASFTRVPWSFALLFSWGGRGGAERPERPERSFFWATANRATLSGYRFKFGEICARHHLAVALLLPNRV